MIENLLITSHENNERDLVSQCCVCKHFVNKDGQYIPLSEEQTFKVYSEYVVSHGFCEPCMIYWLKENE